MIVLDANVLIAHLDSNDAHHVRASTLLADSAGEPLSASPLTLAEVLIAPARAGHLDRAITVIDQLGVATQHLPQDAPIRLALLRSETNLKLPDCFVLLTAEQTQAAVGTFDQRLANAATERGLVVCDH
jgi:predicted nucleic acid-binding protein